MIDSPIKNMLSKLLKGARQIFVFTKNLIPVSGLYQDVLESEHNRGLPEVRDKCYNAIIINTVIIYFMSIQVQLINEYYKVTCYCETCFSAKSLHQLLLLWRKNDEYIKNNNEAESKQAFSLSITCRLHDIS